MAFRVLPEYLLEDVVEFLIFVVTSVSLPQQVHIYSSVIEGTHQKLWSFLEGMNCYYLC